MTMDSSDGVRSCVLRRSSDTGLGFSIMGGAGYEFPPVIYGIEKDSPAARSGLLEAGDIILAINEREVVRLSTKEVLKCLRLSGDIVNIKYKRDPHVVNRVREFLAAPPTFLEGGIETQVFHASSTTQVTVTPSSPLYKGNGSSGKSKLRQVIRTVSPPPNRPSVVSTSSASPPSKRKLQSGHDRCDEVDSSKIGSNHHNITLSDDIFINNVYSKTATNQPTPVATTKSLIPIRSPPHSTNGEKSNGSGNNTNYNRAIRNTAVGGALPSTPFGPVNAAGIGNRKNYETFVMTGDAILNVSKLRNEDSICTPKTTSKLTSLAHGPAPPHQIYSSPRPTKTASPPQPVASAESPGTIIQDSSESSDISPPLPPPPTSESTSSSTSDSITHITVKSDNLPPPPPSLMMEDEQTAQSQSNGIAIAEESGVVKGNESNANIGRANGGSGNKGDGHNFILPKGIKTAASSQSHNNEDTSISSSVMSDSGEDDVENTLDFDGESQEQKRRNLSSKKFSMESEVINSGDRPVKMEKERYNEYVMINGSRNMGHTEADDEDIGKPEALGYEKMSSTPIDSEDEESGAAESDGEESTPPGKRLRKLVSGESSCSGGDSDGSDVESMRVAVIKAVDLPSAERLAKRLYTLDGFKVLDVWRQLSKANDFSREVATYFLRYFNFKDQTLDVSLRKFLNVCPLRGETQERERVLTYFSTRYVECNPNFASQDAVHTLACALMLLNTDMYSGVRGERKMSCKDFIQNLIGLNDGLNFPEPVLKKLYHAIKSKPLASPQEIDEEESAKEAPPVDPSVTMNPKEFKRGYLRRKSIFEQGGKKTPLGKRSWKLCYCRLRELILNLAPDENSKASVVQGIQPLKLHHALAAIANDYRKRPFVFCLTLADKSQFLFQSSDIREMHSWIDNLNLNAAKFSSPALEAPCGSSKKFEKPLLPSAISGLSSRDQLVSNQGALTKWEEELEDLNQVASTKRGSWNKREFKERSEFYKLEIHRYRAYVDVLERHISDLNGPGLTTGEELVELQVLPNPPSVLIEMDENGS